MKPNTKALKLTSLCSKSSILIPLGSCFNFGQKSGHKFTVVTLGGRII